jgi:tetratricopeptide (TPR) repeat protein
MRSAHWRIGFLLLSSLGSLHCLAAQTEPNSAEASKRQQAEELFSEGKRLEALPLLEELAKANPKDDQLLVALAACLVAHAATLSDQQTSGKERLRARALLEQAWKLGNTSPLAMNLSQLLQQVPDSGALKFSDNPQVDRALRAGEAAFSERDFVGARKEYAKALQLDAKNYTAVLFTANTYDRENNFGEGAEWYERAIALDPDVETAFRYYADMLARQSDMVKARTMLIHAAVAEPYNRIVWRELHAWATLNHTQINEVFVAIPATPGGSSDLFTAWQAYRTVRASWQQAGAVPKHFPEEKQYRHSLREEFEALNAAAKVLETLKADTKTEASVMKDPTASLLLKLYQAGLLEPYVLFSLGDAGIARDYAGYRASNRDKLERYVDEFVVPPAPASSR